MKSHNGKVFVLAALCVLFAVVLVLGLAAVWNIIPSADVTSFVDYLTNGHVLVRILVGAAFLVLALGACYFAFSRKDFDAAKQKSSMNLLETSDAGSAYISSAAIDSMVQKCVKNNKYVKSCASTIKASEEGGIVAELRLTVLADCNIPTLCVVIRRDVKKYVESVTGIMVRDVSCAVVGVAGNAPVVNEKRVN
ncbi:MAG: alkaline shock response membrane anchor protein AmaP [Christensenellaceae bacterium]|nr:alkaline shock response membrane anchor protein AmaP [Christensenellaceae bacterium]